MMFWADIGTWENYKTMPIEFLHAKDALKEAHELLDSMQKGGIAEDDDYVVQLYERDKNCKRIIWTWTCGWHR